MHSGLPVRKHTQTGIGMGVSLRDTIFLSYSMERHLAFNRGCTAPKGSLWKQGSLMCLSLVLCYGTGCVYRAM